MKNLYYTNLGILFICKIAIATRSCSQPDLPQYSTQITQSRVTYLHNVEVHYKCQKNFHFKNGQSEHKVICQDGDWEPQPFWKCTDNCQNMCRPHGRCVSASSPCQCDDGWAGAKCKQRVCNLPLLSDHMRINIDRGNCNDESCSLGTTIHFTCESGFEIREGNSRDSCSHYGWSLNPSQIPVCKPVTCRPNEFSHGSYSPSKQFYYPGECLTFECNDGYFLNSKVSQCVSTCTTNGLWEPFWPTCSELHCSSPLRIENGLKEQYGSVFPVGSTVKYTCNVGYVLQGDETLQCITGQDRATWKGSFPRCVSLRSFRQQCVNENKKIVKKAGKFNCVDKTGLQTSQPIVVTERSSSAKPLTIVTATAGGLLLLLLVVITFVAFQRRRLSRHSRRRGRHRLSDDDRYAFLYYSNDFHLVLPSYDEAMQGRRPQPPPYNITSSDTSTTEVVSGNNEGTEETGAAEEHGEHPYETIEDLLRERNRLNDVTSVNAPVAENSFTDSAVRVNENAEEPIYSHVHRGNEAPVTHSDESMVESNDVDFRTDDTAPLITEDC